jgi:signal transduction histidine kinase
MQRNLDRLSRSISALLDFSRMDVGRLPLNIQPFALAPLVEQILTTFRSELEKKRLTFGTDLEPEMPPVIADRERLSAVLENLVVNAIKFTPEGGRVWVEARQDAAGVTVTVGDSGIGMSPDDVTVALTPFGQVDNRLERRYEGTGLGLPLTKALIELHGGRLSFESARGSGTRAMVRFPAAAATPLAEVG